MLLDRLEELVSPEDTSLWVHRAAPQLSDVGIDATLALCNQIRANMLILEELFEGHFEVRWTGTEEDDVFDPELYQYRLIR